MVFIGIDMAWSEENHSGLALLTWDGKRAVLSEMALLRSDEDILGWIHTRSGTHACISIDAPIIAPNPKGTRRKADGELSRDFRRFDAGVYPANRQTARRAIGFSQILKGMGFIQDPNFEPRKPVRRQIEVYPHSAMVVLFNREKIIKYKKGAPEDKQRGIGKLQRQLSRHLPRLDPSVDRFSLLKVCRESPQGRRGRSLKDLEDRLDAVVCAYVGLYYWWWGKERCRVYGDKDTGYIVTPIDDRFPQTDTGHHGPSH